METDNCDHHLKTVSSATLWLVEQAEVTGGLFEETEIEQLCIGISKWERRKAYGGKTEDVRTERLEQREREAMWYIGNI